MEKNEEVESNLVKIRPTQEEFVERRINHKSFAKTIYWLCAKCKKSDFVYPSEISKFMRLSNQRAYDILRDLCKAQIMERNEKTSNLIEFHFVKNGGEPIVLKYLEKAKKTLGLE